ncbi:retrieval of early ER protein Rer1 [Conidiobolus coronatus NRRL 28638]|uniref:Protein RER1 n=1 Tax=Conidiobolus coronatus (strain ATCC 28846 / CBS 209.66 / NRRL 28638) TaxID=796925 RepID=A0A137NU69_CONC2|nr:retrieval of early ER protein Rer1 [Conidiobolus coronatus NRRL 28638]|eukprot:KXN66320.1 retrieval of early ER protein Rer1 [Conidiobolus coronatus NRRL 28638]
MSNLGTSNPVNEEHSAAGHVEHFFKKVGIRYQQFLDRVTPFATQRWVSTVVLAILFMVRIIFLEGWYIVAYALGIYLLNLFLAFLTPKIDPALEALENQEDEDGPILPMRNSDEFRPFIRRLPEFKFWHLSTRAIIISIFCTLFEALNVPVFWPILLFYFIFLFVLTMRRQIQHMIQYRYLPFDYGKKKYAKNSK